jgi:hypothetical protein
MQKKIFTFLLTIFVITTNVTAYAKFNNNQNSFKHYPKIFLFFRPNKQFGPYNEKLNLRKYQYILTNPMIEGAQVLYTWKELEPQKGIYNFQRIENDLKYLNSKNDVPGYAFSNCLLFLLN